MKSRDVFVIALIVCLLLAIGCSDDGKTKSDNDAGPDGGSGESIDFIVAEFSVDEGAWVPIEGATVAFDAPGGERTEDVTGADGKVTFEGIDWSLGTAAATAHKPDYILSSRVGISADNLDVFNIDGAIALDFVALTPPDPPETATVTGTPSGLVDAAANYIYLFQMMAYGEFYAGPATESYEFLVEKDVPFTLVGLEGIDGILPSETGYFCDLDCIFTLDHDPISEDDLVLDLDFGALQVEPMRVDGTIALPEREDSPLRDGWPNVWVWEWNSVGSAGWAETIDINEVGDAFDVSYIWVESDSFDEPYTYAQVWNTSANAGSIIYKDGYPEEGEIDPPLFDVPEWVVPEDLSSQHPLHDPVEWEVFDDDYSISVLNIHRGPDFVWGIVVPPDATSATVPEPPSKVDTEEHLGTGTLTTYLGILEFELENARTKRVAQASPVYMSQ